MKTTLVPFHDDLIEAIHDQTTGMITVVPKRVAENLGLAWSSQLQVLRGHDLLSQKLLNVVINIENYEREAICLPLKYLPLWLSGIQAKRVRPEIRQKLLLYQEECAEVLSEYFLRGGVVVNPDKPMHSTLDIVEDLTKGVGDLTKGQLLLIHEVRRTQRITEANTQEITRLDESKVDKAEFERHLVQQQAKAAERQWHAQRKFPDWVKQWMWDKAGGRCLNPSCRRQLNTDPKAPRDDRPQYDHVLSKKDGGKGTVDNCQLICTRCNLHKRDLYVDYRPKDLKEQAEALARERAEHRAQEEAKRRRQQDFGF